MVDPDPVGTLLPSSFLKNNIYSKCNKHSNVRSVTTQIYFVIEYIHFQFLYISYNIVFPLSFSCNVFSSYFADQRHLTDYHCRFAFLGSIYQDIVYTVIVNFDQCCKNQKKELRTFSYTGQYNRTSRHHITDKKDTRPFKFETSASAFIIRPAHLRMIKPKLLSCFQSKLFRICDPPGR